MLNNINSTMIDINSLATALDNIEIDSNRPIAQRNELTQQLGYSTLKDLINFTNPLKEKALTPKEQAVFTKHRWYLDYLREELADIKPPTNAHERDILGKYISAELWKRHQAGDGWDMLFSPQAHQCFPCWLPNHEINQLLDEAYLTMMEVRHPGWNEFVLSYENGDENGMDTSWDGV